MKKNAFTLIELLATITIIGILTGTAIPATGTILSKNRSDYCNSNISLIITSARDYFKDNYSLLPKTVGEKSEVSLKKLIDEKYISNIYDYNKKEMNYLNSKVLVVKSTNTNYEYSYGLDYGDCNSYIENNLFQVKDTKTDIIYTPDSGKNSNNKDINVTIKFIDNDVRVLSYKYEIYKVNGNENLLIGGVTNYKEYKDKDIHVKLNSKGTYFIKTYVINADGNLSTKVSNKYILDYKIDITSEGYCNPDTTVSLVSNKKENTWLNGNFNFDIKKFGAIYSYDVIVEKTVGGTSNKRVNSEVVISKATSNKSLSYPSSLSATYNITIIGYDENGNSCKSRPYKFYQDNIAPKCTPYTNYPDWTNKTVTLRGDCNDYSDSSTSSGCKVISDNSSDPTRNNSPKIGTSVYKTITNNKNFLGDVSPGVIRDVAGNITVCPTKLVKIDITSPSITCSGNTGWSAGSTSVTVRAKYDFSGLAQDKDPNGTKYGITSNVTYDAIDLAGNKSSCTVNVSSKKQYNCRYRTYNYCNSKNSQIGSETISPQGCTGEGGTPITNENGYTVCIVGGPPCIPGPGPWGGWTGWGSCSGCSDDSCESLSRMLYKCDN